MLKSLVINPKLAKCLTVCHCLSFATGHSRVWSHFKTQRQPRQVFSDRQSALSTPEMPSWKPGQMARTRGIYSIHQDLRGAHVWCAVMLFVDVHRQNHAPEDTVKISLYIYYIYNHQYYWQDADTPAKISCLEGYRILFTDSSINWFSIVLYCSGMNSLRDLESSTANLMGYEHSGWKGARFEEGWGDLSDHPFLSIKCIQLLNQKEKRRLNGFWNPSKSLELRQRPPISLGAPRPQTSSNKGSSISTFGNPYKQRRCGVTEMGARAQR